MKPQFKKDKPVKVLCYNSLKGKSFWQDATVINIVRADDIPYRIEIRLQNGVDLTGYNAAYLDYVKKVQQPK